MAAGRRGRPKKVQGSVDAETNAFTAVPSGEETITSKPISSAPNKDNHEVTLLEKSC